MSEAEASPGRLAQNIMHFARVLRAAGMPIGPGRVLEALRAIETAGIRRRDDFYWTLHSVFVNRRDQRELFDQAFHVFWRNPRILETMLGLAMPEIVPEGREEDGQRASRRLADALFPDLGGKEREQPPDKIEPDATLTFSERDILRKMDFESMTAEEIERAKKVIATLRLPIMEVRTRRFHSSPHGSRVDMRATLRSSMRSVGDTIPLRRREPGHRHPPLVILCDISGSMSRYSRMMLHFIHAVTNDRDRVFTFLFGTRLTNVTRQLRQRDVDVALAKVAELVEDWSGGTRIGATLHQFNVRWSRRVLGQGALVLLISDGLDRDAGAGGLADEIERLHRSCRRLIWLNPLLRWSGFEPTSIGVRTILPHVDEFRPVHNLNSLQDLAAALGLEAPRREEKQMRSAS